MGSKGQWEIFMKSGKVSDYLLYRQMLRSETAQELSAMEDSDASEHRRHSDPRKGDGRE